MTKLKKNNVIVLKNQIVNSFMKNGKKHTGEKILLKLSKSLQKSTYKNFQSLLQLAIINVAPAFKLNEQIMKKGKRKSKKIIPSFIVKDSLRVMTALKSIKDVAQKDKSSNSFYKKLSFEVLDASSTKGASAEQKTKLQTQVLFNKRYLAKFRW
jgi:ribosomal protein S7